MRENKQDRLTNEIFNLLNRQVAYGSSLLKLLYAHNSRRLHDSSPLRLAKVLQEFAHLAAAHELVFQIVK